MNTKNILRHTSLMIVLGLSIGACLDEDAAGIGPTEEVDSDMTGTGDDGWDDDDDWGDDDGSSDDGADDDDDDDDVHGDEEEAFCGDGMLSPGAGEQCDDGNADELDGCLSDCRFGPTDLSIDYEVESPLDVRGGGGGGHFVEECPEGEVIIGLVGRAGVYVDRIQVQCGIIELTSSEPATFEVSLEPGTMLEHHGGDGGSEFSLACEPGQAVVGFSGRSGKYLDRISLRCAPVMMTDDMALGFGETVDTDSKGGGGGGEFSLDCPAGEVATIAQGRSGKFVDALGLTCRPLVLR